MFTCFRRMDESQSEAIDGAEIRILTGYLLWISTYVLVTELPET